MYLQCVVSCSLFLLQAQFISQCMSEIKRELKGGNVAMKANAISKLTYVS